MTTVMRGRKPTSSFGRYPIVLAYRKSRKLVIAIEYNHRIVPCASRNQTTRIPMIDPKVVTVTRASRNLETAVRSFTTLYSMDMHLLNEKVP